MPATLPLDNCDIRRIAISASSSGDNAILAALTSPSRRIRLVAVALTAAGAVNVKWKSGASTDLSSAMVLAASGDGFVLPFNPAGWVETAAGEALNLNLSGAVAVTGHVTVVVGE